MIFTLSADGDITLTNVNLAGGTSAAAILSDFRDETYLQHVAGVSTSLHSTTDSFVAANQRIKAVRAGGRYSTLGGTVDSYLIVENAAGTRLTSAQITAQTISFQYAYSAWFATNWAGTEWLSADINAARLRMLDNNGGTSKPQWAGAWLEAEILTQPVVQSVSPLGALNTRTPIASWTTFLADIASGYTQKKYEVKVYTQAQYTAGGFDPSVTAVTIGTSGLVTGAGNTWQLPRLGDGTYRIYVRIATDYNGTDWFSAWNFATITVSDAPTAPTLLVPQDGATVNTDIPSLGCFLAMGALGARVRAEFQLATDAGFTANLRTVAEDTTYLSAGGITSIAIPNILQLFQATWYMRARQVDEFGTPGPYSQYVSWTVTHPPSAGNLTPRAGVTLPSSAGNYSFTWTFSDTSPVDSQTGYEVIVERNSDGLSIVDTGIVNSVLQLAQFTIPQIYKDTLLRWKVRVKDSDAVFGPYSGYETFYYRDNPTVSITAPLPAAVVQNPQPTVTWTFGAAGGRTQAMFRVVFTRPAQTIYDSGWVVSTATTYTPPTPALTAPISDYSVTVTVQDNTGLQATATNAFTTAWTVPAAPTPVYDSTLYNTSGYVKITWTNAAKDGTFVAWRVYRRIGTTGAWVLLYQTTVDQANYEYDDWLAGSGVTYNYAVVQVATRFAQNVESVYNATAATPSGEDYWLIDSITPANSVRFLHVRSDTYTDEYEQEMTELIGRGRKTDFGTHWGYVGSLTAQVWDETFATARTQKQTLETLKSTMRTLYLRNPFGDVWLVAAQNVAVERVPGVGSREFVNVTVPYSQVS